MKKLSILFIILISFLSCKKKEIAKPDKPKKIIVKKQNKEMLAHVKALYIPRLLKIDNKVRIKIKGSFPKPGYAPVRHIIKRDDNEIAILIYGKPKHGSNSKFTYKITLPPQKQGEYDIVAVGKNKNISDILWVEQYRGKDKLEYLKRLKQGNRNTMKMKKDNW